jgi:hypothetical protein
MPELADILHERESRQPGWRSGAGKGQQVIDRGMDIVSYLYRKLVKEHQFKTGQGKDPRPYIRRAARNWNIDAARKDSRTALSLDEPLNNEGMTLGSSLAALISDPTSVEDEVVNELYYEHGLQQIRTWNFLQEKELGWFAETYVAKRPFDSIAEQFDIPSKEAASQMESRARKKALRRLEVFIVWHILFTYVDRRKEYFGKPFLAEEYHSRLWLLDWAKYAVRPGLWQETLKLDAMYMKLQPLTHTFSGKAGHLYIFCFFQDIGVAPRIKLGSILELGRSYRNLMIFCPIDKYFQHGSGLPGLDKVLADLDEIPVAITLAGPEDLEIYPWD